MSDVFISYARSTTQPAQAVAQALRSLGYGVWRDDDLPAHRGYAEVIRERLEAAKAVVVIWSEEAACSEWVQSEADRARTGHKLVQLRIDGAALPMPFDRIQCADLTGWTGDLEARGWRKVAESVAALVGGPEATARPRGRPGKGEAPTEPIPGPGARPKLELPAKPSIVVLPFKNISRDPDQEYLAEAISEDIVTELSRWRWFFVIGRDSSHRYKDRDVDLAQVSDELGVRYAVEGSVRKIGDRLRVTAQLIDTTNRANLWADRFDRELVDIFALQDEINAQIVMAIQPAIMQGEGVRIARKSLADFSALDCFYRGTWHLNRLSEEASSQALDLFREAIRRDPELSLGYVGLARILYARAIYGWSSEPVPTLVEARDAARTAISLDPRDAFGHSACAGASLYLGEHGAALDEAQRALALNPNFSHGELRLGLVLIFSGRPAEAIAPIERGIRLDPLSSQLGQNLETLALAHYHAKNYERALGSVEIQDSR